MVASLIINMGQTCKESWITTSHMIDSILTIQLKFEIFLISNLKYASSIPNSQESLVIPSYSSQNLPQRDTEEGQKC